MSIVTRFSEARRLHASVRLLQRRIRMDELNERPTAPNPIFGFTAGSLDAPGDNEWPHYFVGTPDKVAARFRGLASEFNLGEFIVNRITHDHEARLRSYSLLAEAVGFETRLSESVAA